MKQVPISFPCGKLALSGYCYYPDKNGAFPGVVLCHPHPLYGGSMSNTVIRKLGSALTDMDIIAMMFDFRGVGKSEGSYGEGMAEQEDVVAAINWLIAQPEVAENKIGLAGYSFGGGVALIVACQDKRIEAIALISPALDGLSINALQTCTIPKLMVVGGNDDMTPPVKVKSVYKMSSEPKLFKLIPQADHFWGGYEDVLVEDVASFFSDIFYKNKPNS